MNKAKSYLETLATNNLELVGSTDLVCILDHRKREGSVGVALALIPTLILLAQADLDGADSVFATSNWWLFLLIALFLAVGVAGFLRTRRAEFHEGFVRIISATGKTKNASYNDLLIRFERVGAMYSAHVCVLRIKGEKHDLISFNNVKFDGPGQSLFTWLPTKIASAP